MGWGNKLGLGRPELRAWAMYDWANSAFITTIVTAVFPNYFFAVATSQGLSNAQATSRLGLTTTITLTISALLAPLLGAIADFVPVKKRLLALFMSLGALASVAMYFIPHGGWVLAAVLFGIGNLGATCSFVFYDALLPHIATADEVDRVSTSAYALGYIGGGILLAAQLAVIMKPDLIGLHDAGHASRVVFVSVGIWWVIFSIPLFRKVAEPPISLRVSAKRGVLGSSISGLKNTLRELSHYKQALLFMVAFLIFNDGIGTIIRMATIFGSELHFSTQTLITAILITQFVGIPFAFGFGALAGRIGAKKSIYIGLVVYCCISILGYFMQKEWHFIGLAVLVGMVQGGTQALSRSLFASMIPKAKSSEFFGLFAVFERFAGIIGPFVFTAVVTVMGSSRIAILAVIAFFIVGMFVLSAVDVEEGRRVAAEANQRDAEAVAQ